MTDFIVTTPPRKITVPQSIKATTNSLLMDAVAKHQRVALLYSGGIESSLLLHLAAPWRSQVAVYTVRTGAEFPHMIAFIDRMLKGWNHRVITTNLAASFDKLGLPASVVPIEHMQGIAATLLMDELSPRIVPWTFCCAQNRNDPGCAAIKADGISAVFHGQRSGDYAKSTPAFHLLGAQGLEVIAPLWRVSRDEVWAGIREFGVELPEHYAEYPASLDCSICPAALTTKRREWMASRFPDHLAVAEKLHAQVRQAVVAALDGDNTANAFSPK